MSGDRSSGNYEHPCQPVTPLEPPNLSSLSEERRERHEAVREAIRHAWAGYAVAVSNSRQLIPGDDLRPLSNTTHSWLNHAATLHDSLDTLYLAQLSTEYEVAVEHVLRWDIQTTSLRPTKTFEYSLRVLGGLLGAFAVSADTRLLAAARQAADALWNGPFSSSPTALPRMFDILAPSNYHRICVACRIHQLYAHLYQWGRDQFTNEHHYNSLAGIGSFAVEFRVMTHLTGDPKYRAAADAIYNHIYKYTNVKNGKAPAFWNVMTGKPTTTRASLGSGSDSFYEYLFKAPLVDGCAHATASLESCAGDHGTNQRMLQQYQSLLLSLDYRNISGTLYPVVEDGRTFHHLLCFLPGLLALTGNNHVPLAHQLAMGCYNTYLKTFTGLGPEQLKLGVRGNHAISDPAYLLRPELVESLFILWRRTGDVVYQDMAWSIFASLEEHCRVEHGYAGIRNVMQSNGGGYVDDMPSYFIAETLKYLLLLFGPDDYVSLDDFVFTTEAHPLLKYSSPRCVYSNLPLPPPVRMPRLLLGMVGLAMTLQIGIALLLLRRLHGRCCQGKRRGKGKNL